MVTRWFVALLTTLVLGSEAHALTYAAYRAWAQGGARVTSLGGAFAAVGDDASSIWVSPAMLPMANTGLDVVLTQGLSFSSEFQPQANRGAETTFRSAYDALSASLVLNRRWSVGVGDGNPFSEGPDNPTFGNSFLQLHETRLSVGSQFVENVSVAAMLIVRKARIRYQGYLVPPVFTTDSEQESQKVNVGLSAGVHFGQNWIFSTAWEQGQDFDLHNPPGLVALGNGIQPVKVPMLTRFGFSKSWPEIKLLLSLQADWWYGTEGLSAFIDSQYNGQQTRSVDDSKLVTRFGVEHQIIERNWVRSWVRTGFYVEPQRVEQNRARDHWTLGVETKLWIVDFNFAFDHASGYSNAATSLGISLTDYL